MASQHQDPSLPANQTASDTPSPTSSHSTPLTVHSLPEGDDIWGTPPHSPFFAETGLQPSITSDIPRLRTTHTTAGYRDGIASARDEAVQPGFDEGHLLGAAIGIRAGYLIGVMEGIVAGIEGCACTQFESLQSDMEAIADELLVEKLLGQDWVGEDGTWKWQVSTADGQDQEDPTIAVVANSHPTLRKWSRRVEAYLQAADLRRGDGVESRTQTD
ncbi:MAG: Essential protein Yae1, N terminal [Stictis urceolatum]|nr:Essential protein Yae1, N terminal [Stictis urceolata]